MSNHFLNYLEREHARLEAAIADEMRQRRPDELALVRLKKQKLIVKDQIAHWQSEGVEA